jgi:hypothetical protein
LVAKESRLWYVSVFFVFGVGIDSRALYVLNMCSTTEPHLQPLYSSETSLCLIFSYLFHDIGKYAILNTLKKVLISESGTY